MIAKTLANLQTRVHAVRFIPNEKALKEISMQICLLLAAHVCNVYVSGGYKSFSNEPRSF